MTDSPTPQRETEIARRAMFAVADHARDAADCRQLLDMLGLTPPKAKRRPGRPPVDHGHGDYRTYGKGCRCDDCREAQRQRCARLREDRAKDPARADRAGHGKASTYKNHGCRCVPCSKANTASVNAFRRQRRQLAALATTGGAR
ncbi:hypothetical protein ACWD48_19860 [Streptomyces sp. NPDC002519]